METLLKFSDLKNATDEELKNTNLMVVDEIKRRREIKTLEKRGMFYTHDAVKFKDKQGIVVYGTIIKINRKTAVIQELNSRKRWKVDFTLLEHAELED